MGNVVRLRNIHCTQWGPWLRSPGGWAVFFEDLSDGIEVPLDRLDIPGELWRTIVHFGMEQDAREQRGLPTNKRLRHRDLGALIMAIHDMRDLWRIYAAGVDVDPRQGHVNQLTRWLMDQVDSLAFPAGEADFITLGGRLFDMEERFNLRAIFATSSPAPMPLHPLAAAR